MVFQQLLMVCLFLHAALCQTTEVSCSDFRLTPGEYTQLERYIDDELAGTCSLYNGSLCADIVRPGVDHVLVAYKRADGNLTELTSILETQWDLLSKATGPTCREALRRVLCYYYYPVCRNATAVVPPKTVCPGNCRYVKDQLCPTEWAAVYNATLTVTSAVPSYYNLHFSECDAALENYMYVPVAHCCLDVVPTPSSTPSASPSIPATQQTTLTPALLYSEVHMITSTLSSHAVASSILYVASSGSSDTSSATIGSTLGSAFVVILVLCILLFIAVCIRRKRRGRQREGTRMELLPPLSPTYVCKSVEADAQDNTANGNTYSTNFLQAQVHTCPGGDGRMVKVPSSYLRHMTVKMFVPGHCLKLLDCVGQGEFGIVYRAYLSDWMEYTTPYMVAVKTMKGCPDKTEVNLMLEESSKMKDLSHPNVLGLIGVCLDAGSAPYIITPFMGNGSLLSYLKKERHTLTVSNAAEQDLISDTQRVLLSICLQIAKGMEYLASQKFVHRDLAARNCMIDLNNVIKVADFGLSEDIYAKNYYRQSDTEECKVKLPIRWMALESFHDGIFSEKTDVWSYGVTCWEVFTLGKIPYPGVTPFSLVKYLDEGGRLEKPSNAACSDEIYHVMKSCWNALSDERPSFAELVLTITSVLETLVVYLDLDVSKCKHVLEVSKSPAISCNPIDAAGAASPAPHVENTNVMPLEPPTIVVEEIY